MIKIKCIENKEEKSKVTEDIIRRLKQWFGIEESIIEYVEGVKDNKFYCVYDDDKPVGFCSIKHNTKDTAEIYVAGILEKYHRSGIGTEMISLIEEDLTAAGYKMFMVKTLSESSPDEWYKKTRLFYKKVGFYPLEEMKELWGEENPCLIMAKSLY